MSVDVSVIIVHYNTPELTRACVKSVLAFTKGCSFEVLVIDNASSVGDVSDLKQLDERVRLLRQEANLGFAGGNNAGWREAAGDYILLLNSDTELVQDSITYALGKLKADPGIGVLSVKLIYPDGRPQYPTGAFPRLSTELLALTRLEKLIGRTGRIKRHYGDMADADEPCRPDWVWGAFWIAPREVIERMPGGQLAEDYFMYAEDLLWGWLIVKRQGLQAAYEPGSAVVHYLSGSGNGGDEESKYRAKIFPNILAFLKKYRGENYAKAFFFVRILHLLSLRTGAGREKARWYWGQVFA